LPPNGYTEPDQGQDPLQGQAQQPGLGGLAAQQMTHQQEQPNPAAPYLEGVRRFLGSQLGGIGSGGIAGIMGWDPSRVTQGLGQAAQYSTPMLGMYKLVPSQEWFPGSRYTKPSQSYYLKGHEDEIVTEFPNMSYDPQTKTVKTDMYGQRNYQKMDPSNMALLKNPGAWSLSMEDKIGAGRAIAREFPEAEGVWGTRSSGAKAGQNELIRHRHWIADEDLQRELDAVPRFPELEKDLFDLAMENIRQREAQAKLPLPAEPPVGNPAWTGPRDPFSHNRPPAMEPTLAAMQRAGFLPPARYRSQAMAGRWANPEMSRIEQGPHGYSVYNSEGEIMAQGVSRNEAIANAERMGAQRPPINTRAHERMFGMSHHSPPGPEH